ncbi:MAG: hypothetical protein IJ309_02430 [Clostridia bacterium]|nr:hypothetical protein [Clostridia bacterium]
MNDYPCDMDKDIELAAFLEHGYENENPLDYRLYFYIYNPQMKYINFEGSNYIQLHSPVLGESYKKLSFEVLSTYGATEESELTSNALLLKCKININYDTIDRSLIGVDRSYHVSGIELDTSIKSNDVYVSSEANKLTIDKSFTDCDVLRINIPTGQESLLITQQGVNLLDPSLYKPSVFVGITVTPIENGIHITGTSQTLTYSNLFDTSPDSRVAMPELWKGKTLTLIAYGSTRTIDCGFYKDDGTSQWANLYVNNGFKNVVTLTDETKIWFRWRHPSAGKVVDVIVRLMVVEGDYSTQDLSYEQYVAPITYELPSEACSYDSIELNKVSNKVFAYSNNEKFDVSNKAWAQELMKLKLYDNATTVFSSSEGVTFSAADIDESKYGVKDYVIDTKYSYRYQNGLLYQTIEYPDHVIETDVVHTYYRIQSEQEHKYYDIRTVAFNVPNSIVEENHNLTAIEACWSEYTTTPILTVDNQDIYQAFLSVENQEVTDFAYGLGQGMHYEMFNLGLAAILPPSGNIIFDTPYHLYSFESFFNPSVLNEWYVLYPDVDIPFFWLYGQNMYDNSYNKLDYVFFNDNSEAWEDENILYSAEQLESKIEGYEWKSDVFAGDPVAFGTPEEPLLIEVKKSSLEKYRVNNDFWEYIFGKHTVSDMLVEYSSIEPIKQSDFKLDDVEFSSKYLIEKSDVSAIKALQDEEYTTYLFRYTVTDYTSENVEVISNHRLVSCQANLSQSVAIKDFDMITSKWRRNDGSEIVIPFVSDPTNAFVDGTAASKPEFLPNNFADDLLDKLRDILTIILVVLIVALVVFIVVKSVGLFADMRIAFGNWSGPKNSSTGRKKRK